LFPLSFFAFGFQAVNLSILFLLFIFADFNEWFSRMIKYPELLDQPDAANDA
jgi:hypothetical protein